LRINYRIVTEISEFAEFQERWKRIISNSPTKNIYLTWEWLYNWWEVYKTGRELFLIVAEEKSELLGVFPLLRRKIIYFGCLPIWRIEFLSTGEGEADEVCPSSMDLIIKKGCVETICQGFASFLTNELAVQWDELFLSPLVKEAETSKSLLYFLSKKTKYTTQQIQLRPCYYTNLGSSWDELLGNFGRKTRKKICQGRRTLEKLDGFSYVFLEHRNFFPTFFDEFMKLHKKRWQEKGAFCSRKFTDFQKRICEVFLEKGWLRLSLMRIGDNIIAGNLDYRYGDTVYGYQTAYDPDFDPKLSIGIQGMVYCLEDAFKEGYSRYDWSFASEGSYKQHFASGSTQMVALRCLSNSIKVKMVMQIERLWRRLKELR